jgi:hypothetical protein
MVVFGTHAQNAKETLPIQGKIIGVTRLITTDVEIIGIIEN